MTKKEKELLEWIEVLLINSPSDREWRNDAIDLVTNLKTKNVKLEKENKRLKEHEEKSRALIKLAREIFIKDGVVSGNEKPFEKEVKLLTNLFLDRAEAFLKESGE